jgi:hypothetical protein
MPEQAKEKEINTMPGSMGSGLNQGNGEDKTKNDSTLLTQAKTAASDVYDSVADKAMSAVDEQKAGLTGKLSGVAETVRRVSGTLQDGQADSPISEFAARYTDTAAQKLDSVARYFDSADLKDIARDIESYARRNPAVFLGSAFAVGIMAARFLKSTPPPSGDLETAVTPTRRTQPKVGGEPRVHAAGSATGI